MPSSIFYGDNQMLPDTLGSSSLFISNSLSVIGTSSFSGPAYISGDLIVNGEISAGNGASIGSGSNAGGINTTASGDYSHAEGDSTDTGIKGYLGSFFVPGVITLSASYGDVSAEFASNNVILDDSDYDNTYGRVYLNISLATYVGSNTELTFSDSSISTTTAIIGLSYNASPLNSDIIFGGYSSHAEGISTIAFGNYSHTEGESTEAIGESSHAEGYLTQAIGNQSHTEGNNTKAIGIGSHAEGLNTIATGDYQHVQGQHNITSSTPSAFIIGNGSGVGSESNLVFAAGTDFQISGSLYVSGAAESGGSGHIITYDTASGLFTYTASNAIGGGGSGSTSPGGSDTEIQFNNGGAFGGDSSFTFIVASQSLQQGSSVIASGVFSHAEGSSTQAIGNYSHAEGNNTQAIGDYAHAEGRATQTGTQAAYSASVSSGVITLDASYGDVSSDYTQDNRLLLYDTPFDANYGIATFLISQSYFTTETIVELYDTTVTTTTAYVGSLGFGIINWAGDQTITNNYSHAEGINTAIIGSYSHAEGHQTQVIGDYAHAEGYNTQAIGNYSHAEGDSTQAVGEASHTEGNGTVASGDYSHAEGYYTTADGLYSHAEGESTQALGDYSHAEGYYTKTAKVSSHSHAEGYYTTASGNYSHAEGISTYTIGSGSHAEGESTIAQGNYSHAEGRGTEAIGDWSHAEGRQTQAIGGHSHAEGWVTVAVGTYSHAGGQYTVASGSAQTVFGSYNAQNNTSSVFIVGIGDAITSKDGFTVDVDANLSGSIMIPTNASDPSSPKTGSMYFNPSTNLLYIYNGTAWRSSSFS